MEWTIEQVRWSFSGRLMGNSYMKKIVCETLLCLPPELIRYITASIWFISSPEDAWAFTLKGSDIKGQYLIVLSDELLREDDRKIRYTILHEIGHAILRHKNSMGYLQEQTEIDQQEQEADQFAREYLS